MTPFDEEKKIKKAYRGILSRELSRPEIAVEKKKLISRHFTSTPVFTFHLEFFAPAVCVLAVFFFFNHVQKPFWADFQAANMQKKVPDEIDQIPDDIDRPIEDTSPVVVKRVASQMGPTMIYHNKSHDIPITVIWVFAEGVHHP